MPYLDLRLVLKISSEHMTGFSTPGNALHLHKCLKSPGQLEDTGRQEDTHPCSALALLQT
jgi:hypothetical protein